jgi:hypothetical protein
MFLVFVDHNAKQRKIYLINIDVIGFLESEKR